MVSPLIECETLNLRRKRSRHIVVARNGSSAVCAVCYQTVWRVYRGISSLDQPLYSWGYYLIEEEEEPW